MMGASSCWMWSPVIAAFFRCLDRTQALQNCSVLARIIHDEAAEVA